MKKNSVPALIVSAPRSNSGKTMIVLGLAGALRKRNIMTSVGKVGPDFIDPMFHRMVCPESSVTLDTWGLRQQNLQARITRLSQGYDFILLEGVMGLFDGGPAGVGSTASLAKITKWPVILIVDVAQQAQSVAPWIYGLISWQEGVDVVGCILNRVGRLRHMRLLEEAIRNLDITLLGMIPQRKTLEYPSRHLGLTPPDHTERGQCLLSEAIKNVEDSVDLDLLYTLAYSGMTCRVQNSHTLLPLGQRISLAYDEAFCFFYHDLIDEWRSLGVEFVLFSPLADQGPAQDCDAIILPGGYPELYAAKLANNNRFLSLLRRSRDKGTKIYGECGGYMVLGLGLEDANHHRHAMAGLLPLATSFAQPQLHIGYRRVELVSNSILGDVGTRFRGHEFHYATFYTPEQGPPLFRAFDAANKEYGMAGLNLENVAGSFVHLLDYETCE